MKQKNDLLKSSSEIDFKKIKNSKLGEKKNEVIICGVKISSPEKIIYETKKISKLTVAKYYESVAKRMLPYVNQRILSVVRCHDGVGGECFFKKHPTTKSLGVKTFATKNLEGLVQSYFYVENQSGLISEVQLGTLEFHTWGSSVQNLNKPDIMVFDLDPDKGMPLEQVRQGVRHLKKVLFKLGLKSFLKTSGGKGYHILVPFKPAPNWQVFYDFARRVAEFLEAAYPNLYTTNIRKNNRKGKIFIDWLRNGKGATSVAPYSLRARTFPTVSMPISWRELDKITPDAIGLDDALKRVKKVDPWKNFFKTNQELK